MAFADLPEGFSKSDYISQLTSALHANGFSNSVKVQEYGWWSQIKAKFMNSPTANITFTHPYGDMNRDAGGNTPKTSIPSAPSVIIYPGLDGMSIVGEYFDTWYYVNATLHEIGHAFFEFKHTPDDNGFGLGVSGSAPTVIDYRYVYSYGQGFNAQELQIIKNSIWGK